MCLGVGVKEVPRILLERVWPTGSKRPQLEELLQVQTTSEPSLRSMESQSSFTLVRTSNSRYRDASGPRADCISDHCAKKLLPWLDGMLEEDEKYNKQHGEPLFSSHMIDLSEESVEYNLDTTAKYLKRAAPMNQWLYV